MEAECPQCDQLHWALAKVTAELAEARAKIEKVKTLPTFKTVGFYRQQIDEILGDEEGEET